ncbi:MAG TPA: four helix bundle protein, partial [Vicinamibacterales bacterium]|nr:four helix bundle protein [Vicinamibacterales bacterium]
LQSQLRRAAVSASTNIVEGCARESLGDYLRFLDIAFSSTREVIYLVSLAGRLSYLSETESRSVTKLADRVAGALLSLRRSLR